MGAKDEVVKLYRAGRSLREIAEMLGRSPRTVSEWTIHLRPPRDPLADAERYDGELTPAENRRRINALRAGHVTTAGSKAKLPGHAPNAGISKKLSAERRHELGGRQR